MKIAGEFISKRSEFSKNTLRLISGTMVAQALSLLASPFLTRLYSPVEFGLLTLVTSIFSMLALISGGRFEVVILIPKKSADAINLLALSGLINLIFLLLFYVVLIFLDIFFELNKIGIWYYLLPLFVLLVGISQSLTAWFNRRKRYREMVNYRVSQSLLNNGLSLLNGFIKITVNGLLSAYLISSLISLGVLMTQLRNDRKLFLSVFSWKRMKLLARQYIRFPLFNSFQAILDASQINGLIYLISILFGQYLVGIFSIAIRILFVPMNLVGTSFSQVFFQEASELRNRKGALHPLMRKTAWRSIVLISPVLIVVLFFGPQLFKLVFGPSWEESGQYARYLCPWICFDFVRAPLSQIPLIINKQKEMLAFSIGSNLMILLLFVLGGILFHDLKSILLAVSLVQVIYICLLLFWIFRKAREYDRAQLN